MTGVLPGPPGGADAGWDTISEATLWCPGGRLSVNGLTGGTADALTDVAPVGIPAGTLPVGGLEVRLERVDGSR
ncbi:hypothetical protein [Actinoplanes sp. NPDC051411]|uniref:hypothetical protein n=1 Tax=Actinoplanes sp. NPDC051411 TaxID=3155522 RepID=UPI0034294188